MIIPFFAKYCLYFPPRAFFFARGGKMLFRSIFSYRRDGATFHCFGGSGSLSAVGVCDSLSLSVVTQFKDVAANTFAKPATYTSFLVNVILHVSPL